MKHIRAILPAILLIIIFSTTAFADWIIFHKPAFRGKVIDAETKEPIEGAVVVAVYRTESIISGPGGGWTTVIKVKETLTDAAGEFRFPSYTTFMNPNAKEDYTDFIIYKPGYAGDGNYPKYKINPPSFVDLEKFFSENYGKTREVKRRSRSAVVTNGVVELPKLKTKKERLRAIPGRPTGFRSKKLPLLYKAINEERNRYKLGEVY